MSNHLSPHTQALLLLTAPLVFGRNSEPADTLAGRELRRLVAHLSEIGATLADLVFEESDGLATLCEPAVDPDRLRALLGRGFQLSQAMEFWQARAIWVVGTPDDAYPSRLLDRMGDSAPPLLYGCGDPSLLGSGGIAVVGSRRVDDDLMEITRGIGRLAAMAGCTVVSGGAKGVDQASMQGALEEGGHSVGMLADNLARAAMARENLDALEDGKLTLVSPYDPQVGFNVGNAMGRNKLIYALADVGLVVQSDLNTGGTWAGAVEQLTRYHFVPVYAVVGEEPSPGIQALCGKGALEWPAPATAEEFLALLETPATATPPPPAGPQPTLPGFE